MALIICPECGQKISNKSKQCIHCGYPLEFQSIKGDKYTVLLNHYGDRLETIKCVRKLLTLDLKPAMNIVDNAPIVLLSNITLNEAEKIKQDFNRVGSEIKIKVYEDSDTENSIPNPNILHCPRCGSTAVTTGQKGFSLFTGFLGSNKTVNRCGNCGWTWEPK